MSLTILTPLGALLALAAVVPLLALSRGESRARGVARALGLPEGRRGRAPAVAVAVVAGLLALAASQPVLALESGKRVRTDAEAYVVLDTTLSMLAAGSAGSETRFDRAKAIALRLRPELDDVPVGIASFTDRVLPHLFPSADREVYAAALERTLRIEQPPPERAWDERATSFGALSALATRSFYSPTATTRVLVLLTDGETRQYSLSALAAELRGPPAIVPVAVHVRRDGERLYLDGRPDPGYESDPGSARALSDLAAAAGGTVLAEDDAGRLAGTVRELLGGGEGAASARERATIPLASWLALAAMLPLVFLVARRSL